MKYWTIVFPGEHGQHVQETWNEEQIIESYYKYWSGKMFLNGKGSLVSMSNCIDDWKVIHWATETDEFGNKRTDE
jgi:hypothetical protein